MANESIFTDFVCEIGAELRQNNRTVEGHVVRSQRQGCMGPEELNLGSFVAYARARKRSYHARMRGRDVIIAPIT